MIDYYARIAPTLLAHLGDRGITMRRFPNGVDAESFFEKRCPTHRPDWVQRVRSGPATAAAPSATAGSTDAPSVVWAANLAALELHAPMARCDDIETPTMVVFDLDPGDARGHRRVRRGRPVDPRRARRARPRVLRQDVGLEGPAGLRAGEPAAAHARTGVGVRARGRAGDGEAPRRPGAVEHAQGAAQGQGLHRLEPELASQDDDLRVLAAGPSAPDGVDAGDVGRGRRRRGRRRRSRSKRPTCSTASTTLGDLWEPHGNNPAANDDPGHFPDSRAHRRCDPELVRRDERLSGRRSTWPWGGGG